MVPTWREAVSSAVTGKDAVMQTELSQKHTALQVPDCRECQSGTGTG